MRKIVDIEKYRVAKLAAGIESMLCRNGGSGYAVDMATVEEPDLWREAAVVAVHRMGYRASAYKAEGRLAVVVERSISEAEQRRAAGVGLAVAAFRGTPVKQLAIAAAITVGLLALAGGSDLVDLVRAVHLRGTRRTGIGRLRLSHRPHPSRCGIAADPQKSGPHERDSHRLAPIESGDRVFTR